jgi:hypothetical protein
MLQSAPNDKNYQNGEHSDKITKEMNNKRQKQESTNQAKLCTAKY